MSSKEMKKKELRTIGKRAEEGKLSFGKLPRLVCKY